MLKFRHFLKETLKLGFGVLLVLSVLSFFTFYQPYWLISWMSLGLFLALTLFSGYYNTRSLGKPFFFSIYLGTMGVKTLISIIFFGLFYWYFKPGKEVIFPFFLIFVIFKIFETALLFRYSSKNEW